MLIITNIYKNICLKIVSFAALNNISMNIEELLAAIDPHSNGEKHEFKLIDGTFTAEEAKRILLEMLNNKVNFHNRQIHRIQEQSNGNTEASENRMNELLDTIDALKVILLNADKNKSHIKIHCPIIIEVI
jgi:hypothetical protein